MYSYINEILNCVASPLPGIIIGQSREKRPITAHQFGSGAFSVSLIGGCHADEPVGPQFLRKLVQYLNTCKQDHPLLNGYAWWIIPHVNPDGENKNSVWFNNETYELMSYLRHVHREFPGDDMEFGFPGDESDTQARPENKAIAGWWKSVKRAFDVHVSVHGMGFSGGPWFLLDSTWKDRCTTLIKLCKDEVAQLGYKLHDEERNGEKGFTRIEQGFSTRPDSTAMKKYFIAKGDTKTAELFRPSSMETMRSLGGDTLTLVSEMPLFITPGVGDEPGPPDPVSVAWKDRIKKWKQEVHFSHDTEKIIREAEQHELVPMPVEDQMRLQWRLITAGIEQVEEK